MKIQIGQWPYENPLIEKWMEGQYPRCRYYYKFKQTNILINLLIVLFYPIKLIKKLFTKKVKIKQTTPTQENFPSLRHFFKCDEDDVDTNHLTDSAGYESLHPVNTKIRNNIEEKQ